MLENTQMRNDIKIGEAALTVAAASFGHDGAPTNEALLARAKLVYAWLRIENKS